MESHVENLERFAVEMPVDVLAHPTLLPLALRKRPLEELWTEAREELSTVARGGREHEPPWLSHHFVLTGEFER